MNGLIDGCMNGRKDGRNLILVAIRNRKCTSFKKHYILIISTYHYFFQQIAAINVFAMLMTQNKNVNVFFPNYINAAKLWYLKIH